jgi:DNA-binding response OmpR family regulator
MTQPTTPPPRTRVLIVESYSGVRASVRDVLTELGYAVSCCRTGAEALSEARRATFDLLISEADLCDMSGLELGRALRAIHPGLRMLFTTNGSLCRSMLQKPFALEQLERAAHRALRGARVRSITEVFSELPAVEAAASP